MKNITGANFKRLESYIKRNGLKASVIKVMERLDRNKSEETYTQDVFDLIMDKEQEEYEREKKFIHRYKFSIVVPAYETGERRIKEMIHSVLEQTYNCWELCIADASDTDEVEEGVKDIIKNAIGDISVGEDNIITSSGELPYSIKYKRLAENRGISENTNEALKMASGEYVVFMDHDDILTRNALFEAALVLEKGLVSDEANGTNDFITNRVKLIYSDEDKCNDDLTEFFDHHVKPDFDIDLLRTNNYICHLLIVRKELALAVEGFDKDYDGAQDHDFIFRCVEKLNNDEIVHIPKVLYHWRSHESSTATNPDSKLYAYEAGKRAVMAHLKRVGTEAEVFDAPHLGFYRVKYKVTAEDLTKIQIVSLDELKLMSRDEVERLDCEYIMVQNDNVRPVNPEYLEELLGILKRDEVGCVGSLVINKGRIESAGYTADKDGNLVADFAGLNKNYSGYLHRAKLVREVDGVCTDCMMIKKSEIKDNGVLAAGKLVVYCPYSVFVRVK